MDTGGIISKLTNNADKLGALAGFLTGHAGGIEDILSSFNNLFAGQVHLPDFGQIATWLKSAPYIKYSIMAYIAGEVMDQVAPGSLARYGDVIKKGALGYAEGSIVAVILFYMTHSDQGSDPTKSGSIAQNFGNAPLVSTYGY